MFLDIIPGFQEACDRFIEDGQAFPARFRVGPITNAKGLFEITWSFSRPDGRATWQWSQVEVDGEMKPSVLWRRIGLHDIFRNP